MTSTSTRMMCSNASSRGRSNVFGVVLVMLPVLALVVVVAPVGIAVLLMLVRVYSYLYLSDAFVLRFPARGLLRVLG